jgi:hypothetical protein
VAGQRDVMIAIFSAFAGFTAFGAVIATFLASSEALPWIAAWSGGHGVQEARQKAEAAAQQLSPEARKAALDEAKAAERWARRRRVIYLWCVAVGMAAASIVSGLGLVFCIIWLREGSAAGLARADWAYRWSDYLLVTEVVLITLITLVAAGGATFYVVKTGPKTAEFLKAASVPESVRVPSSGDLLAQLPLEAPADDGTA